MSQYQNSCIGLNVEFPDSWSFSYWGNRNTVLANPELHQASFNDLPSENSPHKILVTSHCRFERGSPLLKGVLELVALFRPDGIDMEREIPRNESELSRNYGSSVVAGNPAIFLNLEAQGEDYVRYSRYYYWPFRSNIWLGCVISGSSHEKFDEALSILEGIKKV